MISTIKEKRADGWKGHWPDACDCPECGSGKDSFQFRNLCSHTGRHVQATYDTWLECTNCGHKSRPVSKPYMTWYLDLMSGEENILVAAISNWNRDCRSRITEGNPG